MAAGDGPLVPPSDLEFLYSPSAAQVALMCTPCRRQNPKRVNRNHMAYPKGTNPGHIIYPKKKRASTHPHPTHHQPEPTQKAAKQKKAPKKKRAAAAARRPPAAARRARGDDARAADARGDRFLLGFGNLRFSGGDCQSATHASPPFGACARPCTQQ